MRSLSGEKTIEYRTWLLKDIHEFVLVSSATPSLEDFGLKYPNRGSVLEFRTET